MTNSEKPTIAWIGTGVMGSAMCGHLLSAGFPVRVFSRTKARALSLVEAGAHWCESPADATVGSSIVITMVGFPSELRNVVFGEQGVLSTAAKGTTLVDMTTSEPLLAQEIFDAASVRKVDTLDAPVSGGDVGARNASLVIMVGGMRQVFDRTFPVLQLLGKTVTLEGGPGAGQQTKMVNQIAIASGMVGVCEALLYAYRAGLNVTRVIETIGIGAAGSWSLSNYGPRAVKQDFKPGFKVDHFVKDLGIALAEARRMSLALPGLALAEQLYVAASAQGLGQMGTHALILALGELSKTDWSPDATAVPDLRRSLPGARQA